MRIAVTPPTQARSPHAQLIECLEGGNNAALLTLINIEGNAPYPVGAQLLVTQCGIVSGQITGGCAESAMIAQAMDAMQSKQDYVIRYGLNSPYIDIKLPCGSGIDVHFQVDFSIAKLQQEAQQLANREVVISEINSELGLFQQRYLPQERLIIFGQGPILESLALFSNQCGFELIVITQENTQAQKLAKQNIYAVSVNDVSESFVEYCDQYTALVSLFHEHDREQAIFAAALPTNLFYLGALGSQRTQAERLQALAKLGISTQNLERIHGPVGINIGADTPQKIAISILAEVVSKLPK